MNKPARKPLSTQDYLKLLRQKRSERHMAYKNQPAPAREAALPHQNQQNNPPPTQEDIPPSTKPIQHNLRFQSGQSPQPNSQKSNQSQYAEKFSDVPKPRPEEDVFEWKAPSRPFKKRDRQYYTTIGMIVFLISLILFFAGQFLPIAVVISVAFLAYVLSSVPPEMVTNKITTYGIRIEKHIYYWEELGRFWFEEKFKQPVLHIEIAHFPGRINLMLGSVKKEEMTSILTEVLLNQKPEPTFFDKAAEWIQDKVPLEASS